jgi:hypothetical protein
VERERVERERVERERVERERANQVRERAERERVDRERAERERVERERVERERVERERAERERAASGPPPPPALSKKSVLVATNKVLPYPIQGVSVYASAKGALTKIRTDYPSSDISVWVQLFFQNYKNSQSGQPALPSSKAYTLVTLYPDDGFQLYYPTLWLNADRTVYQPERVFGYLWEEMKYISTGTKSWIVYD